MFLIVYMFINISSTIQQFSTSIFLLIHYLVGNHPSVRVALFCLVVVSLYDDFSTVPVSPLS